MNAMEAPLSGLVVLDLSQVIAGPETAMLLGELGADVIKVEKPSGDDARYMGADPRGQRVTKTFSVLNRNKRSLVIDLSQPEGKDVLYRLVEQADIVIEAYTAGTADRMGIGYDRLAELNPRLIYASLTGFGTKGPYASKPAYDLIIQGISGVMAARRWPDGTPIPAPFWVGDASAPFILAFGIMLAAWMREKTGRGQKVESSLLQAHLAMQGTQLVKLEEETALENQASAGFVPYKCGDDEYINVTILNERQWRAFCQVLDVEYLADDPEYNSVAKRQGKDELYGLIEGLLSMRPSHEWQELIQAAGVPCGPVITRDQVFSNPQVVENEFFVHREQPGLGLVQEMGFPLRFSEARPRIQRTAPLLGEHTVEVLKDFGFAPEEVEGLKARGTVA